MNNRVEDIGLPVDETYAPPTQIQNNALIKSIKEYETLYQDSITHKEKFWKEQVQKNIDWIDISNEKSFLLSNSLIPDLWMFSIIKTFFISCLVN